MNAIRRLINKLTRHKQTVDLVRETYDNAFTQGFQLGQQYERSKQTGGGVILSAKVEQQLQEILKKGGEK